MRRERKEGKRKKKERKRRERVVRFIYIIEHFSFSDKIEDPFSKFLDNLSTIAGPLLKGLKIKTKLKMIKKKSSSIQL